MFNSDLVRNVIRVKVYNFVKDDAVDEGAYLSGQSFSIGPGETLDIGIEFDLDEEKRGLANVIAQVWDAELDQQAVNGEIVEAKYSFTEGYLQVYSPVETEFRIKAAGRWIRDLGGQYVVGRDEKSIKIFGEKVYEIDNVLIQNETLAQKLVTNLLKSYARPRQDAEIEWPGNPALEIGDDVIATEYHDNSTGVETTARYKIYRNKLEFDGGLSMVSTCKKISDSISTEEYIALQDTDGASQIHQDTDGSADKWQDEDEA